MNFVLKNYKPTKIKHEELVEIKIREDDEVFVGLPIVAVGYLQEFENPVVFGDYNGVPMVREAKEVLGRTKLFHFKEGTEDEETKTMGVVETTKEEAKWSFRLPNDTPVEELIIIDNQIFLAEKVEKGEENNGNL